MMKEQLISEIQQKMLQYLNNEQLLRLRNILDESLCGITMSNNENTGIPIECDVIEIFIVAKRTEGCSEKTLNYYRKTIESAIYGIGKKPHNRMRIRGVEMMLRKLGKQLNLNKVHPHKFRRAMATSAIDKGMPIEQVQQLLGHQKIDTTMHYAMVRQQNVKLAHRKYIG